MNPGLAACPTVNQSKLRMLRQKKEEMEIVQSPWEGLERADDQGDL